MKINKSEIVEEDIGYVALPDDDRLMI